MVRVASGVVAAESYLSLFSDWAVWQIPIPLTNLLLAVLAMVCGTGSVTYGVTLTVTDAAEAIIAPSNDLTKH